MSVVSARWKHGRLGAGFKLGTGAVGVDNYAFNTSKMMETELFQHVEVVVIKAALLVQLVVFLGKMVWRECKKRKD